MSMWALYSLTWPKFYSEGRFVIPSDPVPWAGIVLIGLAIVMLFEAIRILLSLGKPPAAKEEVLAGKAVTQPVG
jgi:carbon starvation protein